LNIFTLSALKQAAAKHKDAAGDIKAWIDIVKSNVWKNFVELRESFPKADDVDGVIVFNIRHNRYRLLTAVKYDRIVDGRHIHGSVYIKAFFTHAEYDRWSRLTAAQRSHALWPQP
jgi:mRNA interferase HigB